jgi:hypothetical protein
MIQVGRPPGVFSVCDISLICMTIYLYLSKLLLFFAAHQKFEFEAGPLKDVTYMLSNMNSPKKRSLIFIETLIYSPLIVARELGSRGHKEYLIIRRTL